MPPHPLTGVSVLLAVKEKPAIPNKAERIQKQYLEKKELIYTQSMKEGSLAEAKEGASIKESYRGDRIYLHR